MIERRVIDQVIERAEIADVVGDFVTLHRKGSDFVGLCPFHDDTRPSFHVSVSKNICKCFACGEGGTPLTFIMKHENLSFVEAIKYLGRKYGIEVTEKELTEEELAKRGERELLLRANSMARDAYAEALLHGAEGRRVGLSYFRERGLSDETIKHFELGYSPADATFLLEKAKEEGLSVEVLEQVGLALKTKRGDWIDRYRERIIFPIHSVSGNVVGFGGRIMKQVENVGKYINSPASSIYDKSKELYGLYFARRELSKQDHCIVVEGYMDVLWMHQRGIQNVVASSGTALTPQQVQMIKRYTSNVTLIFDSDKAGIQATLRGLDVCLSKAMNVTVVLLPEGEDPDSFARANELEVVQTYLSDNSVDGVRFKQKVLQDELGTSAQALSQILAELAETIAFIDDPITRELYALETAERVGVTPEILGQRIEHIRQERQQEEIRAKQRECDRSRREEPTEEAPPLENIATKVVTTPAKSSVKPPKLDHPINVYENALLRYLLFDGVKFISAPDSSDDSSTGASVIEIVYNETLDLREKKQLTPHFADLLEELLEQVEANPELNTEKYLTWHEDDTIRYFSEQLLTSQVKLSPLHDKFVEEQKEEHTFAKHLYKDILTYKYASVENQLEKILQELRTTEDDESISHLLQEFGRLNSLKSQMGKMLDNRILSPKHQK